MHETYVHKAIKAAVRAAGTSKRVTAHTFRHSFASHLLQADYDVRTVQRMLGHKDRSAIRVYLRTAPDAPCKEPVSPLDFGKE